VAGVAARQRDEAAVCDLRSLLADAPRDLSDAGPFRAAEGAILRRIGESADNDLLNAALATIRSLLQVWLTRLPHTGARATASLAALGSAVEAIARGDVDAARTAMADYVDRASDGIRGILPEEPAERESRAAGVA
jgi:GntR family transcriptional repressor for pyruvate dehydrogenase complex